MSKKTSKTLNTLAWVAGTIAVALAAYGIYISLT